MKNKIIDRKKLIRLIIISVILVLLDQITKLIVLKTIPLYESINIIPDFFNLTHIHNSGGAFGFLSSYNSNLVTIFFLLVTIIAMCIVLNLYFITPNTHIMLSIGFALIFGGALGNFIDRLHYGIVIDFLDFYIGTAHWPAFNVADSAVSIGMVIFVYHFIFNKIPNSN